jgi:hypothetical protein
LYVNLLHGSHKNKNCSKYFNEQLWFSPFLIFSLVTELYALCNLFWKTPCTALEPYPIDEIDAGLQTWVQEILISRNILKALNYLWRKS